MAGEKAGGKRVFCPSSAAAACLGALLFFFAGAARAQISPGPLSKAHQSLSGATQCSSCHTLRAGSPEMKCLDCHTEIARRLRERRGLHAALVQGAEPGKDCARCHSEHNGEEFQMIHWDAPVASFDHRKTGYALEGKHAGIECTRCHTAAHISPEERKEIRIKDVSKSWLGLTRECATCHKDAHNGRFGGECQKCHTFADWQVGTRFDHSKTRFALTGLHAQVSCGKCHLAGADGKPKYAGVAFQSCADCHKDPHRGAFKQECGSCHTAAGWKTVRMAETFDHSKTAYPLAGKHLEVGCVKCHAGSDFKKKIAHEKCADCHKTDVHRGQFRERADRGECGACHTVSGFKPSTFDGKRHGETKYPLEGKHAELACGKCHKAEGAATVYKVKFARCLDCHADAHRGQFSGAPYAGKCERCHTVAGFRPAKYSLAQHAQSRFPLEEGHAATPCKDCHKEAEIGGGRAVRYRFEDRTCTACHKDPHKGNFRAWMERKREDGQPAGCLACHSVKSWRVTTGFDHTKTKFALTGAHRAVSCAGCHNPSSEKKRPEEISFQVPSAACAECHADAHAGQFARGGKAADCATCHTTAKWRPSTFDHERGASFSLKGAHERVACAACHQLTREVNGKLVLFFKPTTKVCGDCHGNRLLPN
ncbi:MAG: hypothetical protein LAN71_08735 [Acidobacteriia bacterium]|nr:hypothetical protein [Terriglobia bacterium]